VASTDIGVSPRVQLREMRIKAHVDDAPVDETDPIVFLQNAPRFLQQIRSKDFLDARDFSPKSMYSGTAEQRQQDRPDAVCKLTAMIVSDLAPGSTAKYLQSLLISALKRLGRRFNSVPWTLS
jgi:hypothetical protein